MGPGVIEDAASAPTRNSLNLSLETPASAPCLEEHLEVPPKGGTPPTNAASAPCLAISASRSAMTSGANKTRGRWLHKATFRLFEHLQLVVGQGAGDRRVLMGLERLAGGRRDGVAEGGVLSRPFVEVVFAEFIRHGERNHQHLAYGVGEVGGSQPPSWRMVTMAQLQRRRATVASSSFMALIVFGTPRAVEGFVGLDSPGNHVYRGACRCPLPRQQGCPDHRSQPRNR